MVCGSIVGFAPQVMSVRMMSSIYGSMTVSVCSRMAQRTVRCILPSYFARKARTSRLM